MDILCDNARLLSAQPDSAMAGLRTASGQPSIQSLMAITTWHSTSSGGIPPDTAGASWYWLTSTHINVSENVSRHESLIELLNYLASVFCPEIFNCIGLVCCWEAALSNGPLRARYFGEWIHTLWCMTKISCPYFVRIFIRFFGFLFTMMYKTQQHE